MKWIYEPTRQRRAFRPNIETLESLAAEEPSKRNKSLITYCGHFRDEKLPYLAPFDALQSPEALALFLEFGSKTEYVRVSALTPVD